MRITVVCTEEEYREIKKRAGLIPLSTWFKHIALAEAGAFEGPTRKRAAPRRQSAQVSAAVVPADSEVCEHGAAQAQCRKWGCKFYMYAR